MEKSIVRSRKLSLVSFLLMMLMGFCFLSYSTQPMQETTQEAGKSEPAKMKKISCHTFEEILPFLNENMKQGLEKPVSLIFTNARPEFVFEQISKMTGVKLVSYGLQDRIDLVHRDVPASQVLHLLSQVHEWTWELQDNVILVYPRKNGEQALGKSNFEEFLAGLNPDLRNKLNKPVTIIFSNTKMDHILMNLGKQIEVTFFPIGIKERMDLQYRDIPASTILRMISENHDWLWENDGNNIFLYPRSLDVSAWKNIDAFFSGLDGGIKEKLQKPVTLIFNNTEATMILDQMSQKTGLKIISQGLYQKIDLVARDVPAGDVLRMLCKGYGWKPELQGGILVITPLKPQSPQVEEKGEIKEIKDDPVRQERINAHRERVIQILEQRNADQRNKR